MSKPFMTMLIGLPGCGKSRYAEKLKARGYEVFSSDAIRKELSGSEEDQRFNQEVFNILHKRLKEALKQGKSVVYDATNLEHKRRKDFLVSLTNIDCIKEAVVIATPYEVCLEWNSKRERVVPEYVINRMYKSFTVPFYNEGWDYIEIAYTKAEFAEYYGTASEFILKTTYFDQDNSHHTLMLGAHCAEAEKYVNRNFPVSWSDKFELKMAAAIHDCGKPFVKDFKDSRGNQCEEAHYYAHEYVGSYNSLFYYHDSIDILLVAALIRWHMLPYFMRSYSEKTKQKYIDDFTSENVTRHYDFWNLLQLLHDADVNAH